MEIDFNDWEQMLNLMEHSEEYPTMLLGENTDGEFVSTSILHDRIVVETSQRNGWVRTNVYHKDFTVEELYRKEPT